MTDLTNMTLEEIEAYLQAHRNEVFDESIIMKVKEFLAYLEKIKNKAHKEGYDEGYLAGVEKQYKEDEEFEEVMKETFRNLGDRLPKHMKKYLSTLQELPPPTLSLMKDKK